MGYLVLDYLVLAFLVAYCPLGWWAAKRELPRAWELAWKEYSNEGYFWEQRRLSLVKGRLTVTFLFWPVVLPTRVLNGKVNASLTETDPVEVNKKLRKQRRYIEQLERELGIGDK